MKTELPSKSGCQRPCMKTRQSAALSSATEFDQIPFWACCFPSKYLVGAQNNLIFTELLQFVLVFFSIYKYIFIICLLIFNLSSSISRKNRSEKHIYSIITGTRAEKRVVGLLVYQNFVRFFSSLTLKIRDFFGKVFFMMF